MSVWAALIKDKEDKQAQLWPAVLNRTRLESKTGRPTNCVSAGVQLPPPPPAARPAHPPHPPGRRRPRSRAHPYVAPHAPFLILTLPIRSRSWIDAALNSCSLVSPDEQVESDSTLHSDVSNWVFPYRYRVGSYHRMRYDTFCLQNCSWFRYSCPVDAV
jgi:hypothetical protein